MDTPTVTQEGLFARVDGQAAAKKAAIVAGAPMLAELNTLTAQLHEAGLDVSPVVTIHDNSISAWVQCYSQEETILRVIEGISPEGISTGPVEWLSDRGMEFRLPGCEVPIIAPHARIKQREAA